MSVRELAGQAYARMFARPGRRSQAVNHALFHLALRGMGYNNGWQLDRSGEAEFIARALAAASHVRSPLVVDAGANQGLYSREVLRRFPDARVLAFEPLPGCWPALEGISRLYPGQFSYRPEALGEERGQLELRYGTDDSEWASLSKVLPEYAERAAVQSATVPVSTLSEALRAEWGDRFAPIDLLKIDVEGWEAEVLRGAQDLLRVRPPRWIQLEMNLHQLLRGHTLRGLASLLPGYVPFQILPGRRGLLRVDLNRPEPNVYGYANFAFRRDWAGMP